MNTESGLTNKYIPQVSMTLKSIAWVLGSRWLNTKTCLAADLGGRKVPFLGRF